MAGSQWDGGALAAAMKALNSANPGCNSVSPTVPYVT
jgi:hypothetical protein